MSPKNSSIPELFLIFHRQRLYVLFIGSNSQISQLVEEFVHDAVQLCEILVVFVQKVWNLSACTLLHVTHQPTHNAIDGFWWIRITVLVEHSFGHKQFQPLFHHWRITAFLKELLWTLLGSLLVPLLEDRYRPSRGACCGFRHSVRLNRSLGGGRSFR